MAPAFALAKHKLTPKFNLRDMAGHVPKGRYKSTRKGNYQAKRGKPGDKHARFAKEGKATATNRGGTSSAYFRAKHQLAHASKHYLATHDIG
jgi:hypothetical protein